MHRTRTGDGQESRVVAFYLPQFHAIPENDEWWGKGFTEWTNVRRARPLFEGHDHPRQSTDFGEYVLTTDSIKHQQSELARAAGISAFCMYYYWFDGRRLLERPLEQWREDAELLPYCLSWANEAWTRRWDGKEQDVLMPQTYGDGFEEKFFEDALPHLLAPHYLRVEGQPVLLVHRADLIPSPRRFASVMKERARSAGLQGLYLVAAETKRGIDPRALGFDALAEFPPVGGNTFGTAYLRPLKAVSPEFRGRLMSYPRLMKKSIRRRAAPFVRHPGVMPGWDNTARRGHRATVYVGSSARLFGEWAKRMRDRETADRGGAGLVFINAWNEWAEGAYLEPDKTSGHAYLDALRGEYVRGSASSAPAHSRFWGPAQGASILQTLAGSVLNIARQLRSKSSRISASLKRPISTRAREASVE